MAYIKHQLEYFFLKQIIDGLRDDSFDVPKAKEYASEFLSIEPFISVDDAYQKINQFVEKHAKFAELKDYIGKIESEKDVAGKIEKMREHIKQNDIDAALMVAKS